MFRQGFLEKLGANVKNWKTRLFTLSDSKIYYRKVIKLLTLMFINLTLGFKTVGNDQLGRGYCRSK